LAAKERRYHRKNMSAARYTALLNCARHLHLAEFALSPIQHFKHSARNLHNHAQLWDWC